MGILACDVAKVLGNGPGICMPNIFVALFSEKIGLNDTFERLVYQHSRPDHLATIVIGKAFHYLQ